MAIEIKNKVDCCGCTACESSCGHGAIRFEADEEGFMYPIVDLEKCTDCHLCESACPIIERRKSIPEPDYKGLYAARIKNRDILMKSSSGGLFSAIALSVIEDGGKVIGAVYDEDMVVKHAIAATPEELAAMRGSKYSQSDIRGIFKQIRKMLVNGEKVLFSGTPCQVEGLKLFLRKPYENLLTIDIVCHAVPSPKIFKEYVDLVNDKFGDRLIGLNMRDKAVRGWSHNFSYRFTFGTGKEVIDTKKISNWGRLYFSRLIDRPSCHECLFTNYSRPGDITLADFWDDAIRRPDLRDKDGTSLFIANTNKGFDILSNMWDKIDYWSITREESYQPCLCGPTPSSPLRPKFWDYYLKKGFKESYKKYFTDSMTTKLKKRVKNILRPILKPIINYIKK